jgi:HEAT repeat protein
LGAGALAWVYWPRTKAAPTAQELAQQALSASSVQVQTQAAIQLGTQGAMTQLREVVAEARDPEVRAAAVQGLGDLQDFQSVPELLALCNDSSALVRGRAGAALSNILGADFGFEADAPAERRTATIEAMRKMYEQMRRNPPPKYRSRMQ